MCVYKNIFILNIKTVPLMQNKTLNIFKTYLAFSHKLDNITHGLLVPLVVVRTLSIFDICSGVN